MRPDAEFYKRYTRIKKYRSLNDTESARDPLESVIEIHTKRNLDIEQKLCTIRKHYKNPIITM